MGKCQFCNKVLSTAHNLRVHQRTTRYCLGKQREFEDMKKERELDKKKEIDIMNKNNKIREELDKKKEIDIMNKNKKICEELDDLKIKYSSIEHAIKLKKSYSINKERKSNRIPQKVREQVFNAYADECKGKCFCCKDQEIAPLNFHCGHVISAHHGGDTTISNLRPICALCNSSMRTMNMLEFQQKFGFQDAIEHKVMRKEFKDLKSKYEVLVVDYDKIKKELEDLKSSTI